MHPVTLTVHGSIAHIVIGNPPVNALNQAVRQGLAAAAEQVERDAVITGVVLSCAGRTFVSGADINELGNPLEPFLPEVLRALQPRACPGSLR